MAHVYKLPSGLWRAQVARKGRRDSGTFGTKSAAQQWAGKIEAEIVAVSRGELPRKTVRDALERFRDHECPKRKGGRWEALRLNAYAREEWADRWLAALSADDLSQWRDRRLKVVLPASVQRDFNLLRSVLTTARKEWRWLDRSPMDDVSNPGGSKPRTRRLGWREIRAICRALGYPGESKSAEVALAFLIALRTAMRSGEILSLTPAAVDLKARVAKLTDTKNGDDRDVPMTRAGARLFVGWKGWTVDDDSRDVLFRRARDRCGLVGLTFHDSRAEALTRLARKVDVLTLAKISGHRDLGTLMRVYYRETAAQIAARLD